MSFSRLMRFLFPLTVIGLLAVPASGQNPVGELLTQDAAATGAAMPVGGNMRVLSGATVAAGQNTSVVKLLRGGTINVCRGSSVSVTASASGQQIMMGLSSGTMEAHYNLPGAGPDSIMTPDFQLQLLGPGAFHYAISADDRGNVCVQSMPNATGTIRISELMGDRSYDIRPSEQWFFRNGKAANPGGVVGNCGCPLPPAMLSASAEPAAPAPTPKPAAPVTAAVAPLPPPPPAPVQVPILPVQTSRPPAVINIPPIQQANDIHVAVEAPFVFRASEPSPIPPAPYNIARIRLSGLPELPAATALPPTAASASKVTVAQAKPRKKRRGFWGLLASIFGG
jgi:hypothetical protein